MADVLRLLLVDDHPLVADALARVFRDEDDVEVVGVANNAATAVALASAQRPDVVLLDYRLPDATGPEVAASICAILPDVALLFLSGDDSEPAMLAAVEAGASGYLFKASRSDLIVDAVRRVGAGEFLIPARVLQRLLAVRRSEALQAAEVAELRGRFTAREMDVLKAMAQGLDNAAIAGTLTIEVNTVRWHVRNVIEKLGAHSKLEAVTRAAREGLL